jgi:hypothetical protein
MSSLAMAVFGTLTIRNIRSQTKNLAQVRYRNRHRRTESQLSRMLIMQVGTYLLFSISLAVTYVLITFASSIVTSVADGIRTITTIWQLEFFSVIQFIHFLGRYISTRTQKMFHFYCNQNRVIAINNHPQVRISAKIETIRRM